MNEQILTRYLNTHAALEQLRQKAEEARGKENARGPICMLVSFVILSMNFLHRLIYYRLAPQTWASLQCVDSYSTMP